jgi:hypothetical protein
MRIIIFLEYNYVKDIDIFSWVLVISDYVASCDYECHILWDIE